jgi:hypothetical protein
MKLLYIERLRNDKKKYVAVFSNGKRVKFGAAGYDDYTTHHDKERRNNYLRRHAKDLSTEDPMRAGFLAYYLLWGPSTSLEANIRNYKKMFGL